MRKSYKTVFTSLEAYGVWAKKKKSGNLQKVTVTTIISSSRSYTMKFYNLFTLEIHLSNIFYKRFPYSLKMCTLSIHMLRTMPKDNSMKFGRLCLLGYQPHLINLQRRRHTSGRFNTIINPSYSQRYIPMNLYVILQTQYCPRVSASKSLNLLI